MPSGVPMALAPILIPIEILSYLSRPVSLSIRLFANMMAGHTMLKVFGGFSVLLGGALGGLGYTVGILPLAINVALVVLKPGAMLQALRSCPASLSATPAGTALIPDGSVPRRGSLPHHLSYQHSLKREVFIM